MPLKKEVQNKNKETVSFDIAGCYNIKEIQEKYTISRNTVNQLIKRHDINLIRKGKYVYVQKTIIDKHLN